MKTQEQLKTYQQFIYGEFKDSHSGDHIEA
jgi:hypothetical protein